VRARLRDETGLVGRSTVVLMVLVVIFGLAAVEGGSILFTRLSLQDTADAVANAGAGSWYNAKSFRQAEEASQQSLVEHDPTAKLVGFQVDPSSGNVTVTLKKVASTMLVQRFDFTKKIGVIRVSSTAGPPTV
jgi:uncharacterized membrane protein